MNKIRCSQCNKRTKSRFTIGYFDYCDRCYHNIVTEDLEEAQQLTRQQLVKPDNYDYQK